MITHSIPDYIFLSLKELFLQADIKQIQFRADDIGQHTKEQDGLLRLFVRYQIPLNLGIIPLYIDDTFLNSINIILSNLHLFCLCQHGYRHKNYSPTPAHKYEFGQERNTQDQMNDLRNGKQILLNYFGNNVSSVFIPPWNYTDMSVNNILKNMDYTNISIFNPDALINSTDMTVDLHTTKCFSEDKFYSNLLRGIEKSHCSGYLGIMIHHTRMTIYDFFLLEYLLQLCKSNSNIQIVRFDNSVNQLF